MAAAAVVLVVVAITAAAGPAFAGWRAVPTVASPERIKHAAQACGSLVPPVIVDTRGPYTAAVFGGRNGGVACLQGPAVSFAGQFAAGARFGSRVAADQIQTFVAAGADPKRQAFVLLAGRVGSDVTAVVIHRGHGHNVLATLRNGWYLAWWPAQTRATGATVTTNSGSHTIKLPALATAPPLSCAGSNTACAAVGGGTGASGLLAGPPMIGGTLHKPFRSVLLFLVYNATNVQLCVHLGAAPKRVPLSSEPATNCASARLIHTLPRTYPVQRNLLELFHDSVWMVSLPRHVGEHGRLTAYLRAFGLGRWRRGTFGEITAAW